MTKHVPEHRLRGFRLKIQQTHNGYGVALEETDGLSESSTTVAKADETATRAILASVMNAVKSSGHGRSVLGPQRKAPIELTEEAGIRLALVLLTTGPVTKARRVDTMAAGIEHMAAEEAYYWYAKCVGSDAGRTRKALRIFLAEE